MITRAEMCTNDDEERTHSTTTMTMMRVHICADDGEHRQAMIDDENTYNLTITTTAGYTI